MLRLFTLKAAAAVTVLALGLVGAAQGIAYARDGHGPDTSGNTSMQQAARDGSACGETVSPSTIGKGRNSGRVDQDDWSNGGGNNGSQAADDDSAQDQSLSSNGVTSFNFGQLGKQLGKSSANGHFGSNSAFGRMLNQFLAQNSTSVQSGAVMAFGHRFVVSADQDTQCNTTGQSSDQDGANSTTNSQGEQDENQAEGGCTSPLSTNGTSNGSNTQSITPGGNQSDQDASAESSGGMDRDDNCTAPSTPPTGQAPATPSATPSIGVLPSTGGTTNNNADNGNAQLVAQIDLLLNQIQIQINNQTQAQANGQGSPQLLQALQALQSYLIQVRASLAASATTTAPAAPSTLPSVTPSTMPTTTPPVTPTP